MTDDTERSPIVTFIGEDNPYGADPEFALYPRPDGCSGHRLCDYILGLSERDYLRMGWIERRNLCGAVWGANAARDNAVALLHAPPSRVLVPLGAKVRDAFQWALTRLLVNGRIETWTTTAIRRDDPKLPIVSILPLPHPSGRNTIWNEAAKRALARSLLRSVAPEIPWGEP